MQLTPGFSGGPGNFAPASQSWLSDGSTPLAQSFTFTATGATVSPVTVTWTIAGTNQEIFETAVQSAVTTVMIYNKEKVSIYTASNLTDGVVVSLTNTTACL